MKAADDFASKVGSGKGVDRQNPQGQRERKFPQKKESSQIKNKSKGNPKGNPKGIKEESPHSQTKQMERVQKTWYPPARPGGGRQEKMERKTQEQVVRKEKNNDGRSGVESKEGSKSDLQ